jgi:hypothetical protein
VHRSGDTGVSRDSTALYRRLTTGLSAVLAVIGVALSAVGLVQAEPVKVVRGVLVRWTNRGRRTAGIERRLIQAVARGRVRPSRRAPNVGSNALASDIGR